MKKYIFLLIILPLLFSCERDNVRMVNRFLPDYNFSIGIDMSLPLYSQLRFTGNPVYVNQAGIGINGIIVMNIGGGYVAYEASCPNQPLDSCSRLELNGIIAVCPCDDAEYNLYSSQATGKEYPLKSYRIEVISPTFIRVYN